MGKFQAQLYDQLSTYVSHLAWLDAVPEEGKKSRRDIFEKDGLELAMPECEAHYILEYLFDGVGVSIGDHAITYSEIESWQRLSGIELQPFEAKFLKKLSEAYLRSAYEAKDKDAETPWEDAPGYMSKSYLMAKRMKESIRGMIK